MKSNWTHLEPYRKSIGPMATAESSHYGAFYLRIGKTDIIAIASAGSPAMPWEHVSLQARDYNGGRTPTWAEMCYAKSLFGEPEECVVQYHPPESDYVNTHPHVLHLWKPIGIELPRPPKIAV